VEDAIAEKLFIWFLGFIVGNFTFYLLFEAPLEPDDE
jgi:hypothetical protein